MFLACSNIAIMLQHITSMFQPISRIFQRSHCTIQKRRNAKRLSCLSSFCFAAAKVYEVVAMLLLSSCQDVRVVHRQLLEYSQWLLVCCYVFAKQLRCSEPPQVSRVVQDTVIQRYEAFALQAPLIIICDITIVMFFYASTTNKFK